MRNPGVLVATQANQNALGESGLRCAKSTHVSRILLAIVGLVICSSHSSGQSSLTASCPPEGSAKLLVPRTLNKLKNRTAAPAAADFDPTVTLERMLGRGDDRNRFDMRRAAKVQGFVVNVKQGAVETVNCGAREADDRDTHIELAVSPGSVGGETHVIVEVTPYWRAMLRRKGVNWSTAELKRALVGRQVEVAGWLLFDREHQANALNTASGRANIWRATSWELHPITAITVLR